MTDFLKQALAFLAPQRQELLEKLILKTAETAENLNITAHTSKAEILFFHIADSLALQDLPELACSKTICDVGTGGGFPGLPLAAVFPEKQFTLLDATEKKIAAIKKTSALLEISNVTPIAGRAEKLAREAFRDHFDFVVSRAVAPLPMLAELCLPLVKKDGFFLAMKGKKAKEELREAEPILAKLGGKTRLLRQEHFETELLFQAISTVPTEEEQAALSGFAEMTRYSILIQKERETMPQYPRAFAQIKKANL